MLRIEYNNIMQMLIRARGSSMPWHTRIIGIWNRTDIARVTSLHGAYSHTNKDGSRSLHHIASLLPRQPVIRCPLLLLSLYSWSKVYGHGNGAPVEMNMLEWLPNNSHATHTHTHRRVIWVACRATTTGATSVAAIVASDVSFSE